VFLIHFHIDNLYTRVDKKIAIKEELEQIHKILSVRVPGYFYSPHFRRGLWDGYRRFFNLLTCTFYTGLIDYVISKIEFPHEIIDDRILVESKNNILSLNGITLRDYQIKMINEAVSRKRGIISAPPNAGKTEVACGIIQVLGLPTNFFTHRITLMKQTRARMEQRLGIKIGMIGAGIKEIEDINVLSVPSIVKNLNDPEIKEMLSRAKVVISDECHHIQSKTFESCLKACNTSYYRYGLSATALLKDEISNLIVRGLTGDEIVSVTNRDLINAGISALPTAYLYYLNEPKIPGHYTFDQAYEKGILNNLERNSFIVMSAKRFVEQGKSVFILVWRIAHGEVLLKMLEDIGLEVEFISGGRDNVQESLDRFKKKKLKCLISSTISDEGLDVPAMDVLIMGVGFKAPLKTIQRVGRALRKKPGENVVTIVDFVDAQNKKYLYKHSEDRVREYLNMGMDIFEVEDENWEFVKRVEL
jgi:superfamily II DNA or RNA helicase